MGSPLLNTPAICLMGSPPESRKKRCPILILMLMADAVVQLSVGGEAELHPVPY